MRRAPDIRQACAEAYGPAQTASVASLRALLGVIGAHEWRRSREQRAPYDAFLEYLLTTERVRVDPLVTHRVAFADAQRAYEGLRDEPASVR